MTPHLPRRRFLQLTGGTALGATLLTACGSASGAAGNQIAFWNSFGTTDIQRYYQQNFVDAYNKTTSGAKVQMSVKQVATLDRLTQTAVASGNGPDVISTSSPSQALNYVGNGNLLPLDPYIDKLGWTQAFLPWALDVGRVAGKLYSLPASYETMAVFYNPGTFSAHGWKPPTSRAEFEAICADAAAKGIMPVGAGNAEWQAASEWHVTWVWNTFVGPQSLYEALTGKLRWTDPVFVDAIAMLKSWFDKGWFGGGTNRYFTNKFTDMYPKLASGAAAMMVSGSWTFTEIGPYFGAKAGNNATWDWAPLPSTNSGVPAGVYPLSVGNSYSINKDSKNPAAAAAFLNFLVTGPTRQLNALAAVGLEPTPIKLAESDFPASTDPRMKRQYLLLNATKNYGYTTWTFWPAKSDTYIYQQIDKVLVGQLTPKDYCAGLDSVFQQELKAGKVPPLPAPMGA